MGGGEGRLLDTVYIGGGVVRRERVDDGHNNRVQMKLLPHPDVNYRKLMEFYGTVTRLTDGRRG